jgi:glycosyltransferase involved in cell wall biosynthesis
MISYSILTHNEDKSLSLLLNLLVQYLTNDDEIVILDDFSTNEETLRIIDFYKKKLNNQLIFQQRSLNGDFSTQKNYLNKLCTKKWIFNLDADETPSLFLIENIKLILNQNNFDLYFVPRQNIINGVSKKDLINFNFKLDDLNRINWPDFQGRIYLNNGEIYWENKIHEIQKGYKSHCFLPYENTNFSILHIKDVFEQYKIKY